MYVCTLLYVFIYLFRHTYICMYVHTYRHDSYSTRTLFIFFGLFVLSILGTELCIYLPIHLFICPKDGGCNATQRNATQRNASRHVTSLVHMIRYLVSCQESHPTCHAMPCHAKPLPRDAARDMWSKYRTYIASNINRGCRGRRAEEVGSLVVSR